MSAASWEDLTARLRARLPGLQTMEVISLKAAGNRYTQLIQRPTGLTLEATANEFLPPDGRLTPEQEKRLRDKGWLPPDPPGRNNWWYDIDRLPLSDVDTARVVDLMVCTLRDVYLVAGPADVTERSFTV
ncbi:TY-Chap domain-containing protein [Actinoplanes awajinensis]|uniref:TY-Chap N-terminal domain-containing protein n=1 Tax=Actinoplanes awajinensis subsp. mycoplanecinus TaxID=135947 RepID=A0A117MMP3_9ACTN|nr:hypothetical protein [Actinoplanes awajinensis]KUL25807.1 hypothetical protein ADL15_39545 [Actinoplanes awajinensis subsp. mycoplanecinus]